MDRKHKIKDWRIYRLSARESQNTGK